MSNHIEFQFMSRRYVVLVARVTDAGEQTMQTSFATQADLEAAGYQPFTRRAASQSAPTEAEDWSKAEHTMPPRTGPGPLARGVHATITGLCLRHGDRVKLLDYSAIDGKWYVEHPSGKVLRYQPSDLTPVAELAEPSPRPEALVCPRNCTDVVGQPIWLVDGQRCPECREVALLR